MKKKTIEKSWEPYPATERDKKSKINQQEYENWLDKLDKEYQWRNIPNSVRHIFE